MGMDRRRFIISAVGAGLATSSIAAPAGLAAAKATDEELAYANFGLATELLLKDFHAKTVEAKLFAGTAAKDASRSGFNAGEHAASLARLLRDAGEPPAVEEDFAFEWPDGTFATKESAVAVGIGITQSLLGVYLGACSAISIASYRTLFASMGANVALRLAALSQHAGTGRVVGNSFPAAVDIETASDAIDDYLG